MLENVRIVIWSRVARNVFILISFATIAFFLGNGYYKSFRSGVLTLKGRTYRRNREPIGYWLGMLSGTFAFLVIAAATALMAALVSMNLFGR